MRIAALELSPYGHLTHARLELLPAANGPGLHVLKGRNGAGKSTSLRALDGALFGIPRRTRDEHTHPGPALKVAFELERADGEVLSFERRKRDKQSLFAPDGAVVDEAVLRECLGGLPPEEFRAMFLLDCGKLEEGSADLLEGRGLLGEALFGAALGLGRVHRVLAELEAETEALWVKGGARTLNHHLKELCEARKEKRHCRLDPETWAEIRRELEEAEHELVALKDTLRDLSEQIGRAARHERCLEPLARRRGVLERLDEIAAAPTLPVSFPGEVRAAHAELEEANRITTETRDELERVASELEAHPDLGPIADREDTVNTLYRRAGESAKASKDLPRREAELTTRRGDLARLLARAGANPEQIDTLRVTDADRARLDELVARRAALGQAHEDASNAASRLRRRAATNEASKPGASHLSEAARDALSEAIDAARDAGDLDAATRDARDEARRHVESAERACATLPGWSAGVPELESLRVPSTTTLQRFTRERVVLNRTVERLDDRAGDLDARAVSLAHDADRLAAGPRAPTRAEVDAARHDRDHAIDALIEHPEADDHRTRAVRDSVRTTDDLGDARAENAEVAAARERLERDSAALKTAREQLSADRAAAELQVADFAERWATAWPGLPHGPRTPEEMREWLVARVGILETTEAAREDEARAKSAERAIAHHRAALAEPLAETAEEADPSASLASALLHARATLAAATSARTGQAEHERERARLAEELSEASDRVDTAERELAQWRKAWAAVTKALGMAAEATPAEARAQLTAIDDGVAASDDIVTLQRRVETLHKDEENFAKDARALAAELAPDLADRDPLTIADALHARASKARSARAARKQLEPRQRDLAQQAATAARIRASATERLGAFAQRSSVKPDGLDELCTVIDARTALREQLARHEAEIEAAGASPAAKIAAELVDATPEGLAAARAADEDEARQLEDRRGDLERTTGRLRAQLETGGSDEAALAGERAAHARASVVDGLERYAELCLATTALRAAIERHRRQHQGPLLERASELFARLSGGKMTGLSVVTAERQPYIMGVLPGNREVPVQDMSSGQRHQLFLALRFASLERHFGHNEPMPLVLDDLLVQLDDVSARAALEILAELACVTEVLFFTHHDHLVTMARETVPAELLVEHTVGEETRSALRAA